MFSVCKTKQINKNKLRFAFNHKKQYPKNDSKHNYKGFILLSSYISISYNNLNKEISRYLSIYKFLFRFFITDFRINNIIRIN
jgi:hypothetical protein